MHNYWNLTWALERQSTSEQTFRTVWNRMGEVERQRYMTQGGDVTAELGWIDKEFQDDVPPGRRALAVALQGLCHHLRPAISPTPSGRLLSQASAADRLLSNASSLSRFLSGKTVPGPEFLERLHKEACSDAGGGDEAVGVTLDELTDLRTRAAAERRCHTCAGLSKRIDSLTRQLHSTRSECVTLQENTAELASIRQRTAALEASVAKLEAARAGLQARLAAQSARKPLPVPRRKGDRQRMQKDVAAVRQLAEQAKEMHREGRQDAALTLLRQTTEVLSPVETAIVLCLLRQQQQDHLADNLIHIYGRDQAEQDIMQVALELHEQGSPDDAGAILRAALG